MRLIALLRQDARRPTSSLAAALGVARATVKARIDKLLESGAILGFTAVVKGDAAEPAVRAIMLIEVQGRAADAVARALRGLPEVRQLYTTNGRWDLAAELGAETLAAFDALLSRVRLIEGVVSTETNILLASRK